MNAQNRIEEIRKEGYYIDFGDVFNKAFENYKKIALMAGLLFILLSIIIGAVTVGVIAAVWGASAMSENMTGFEISEWALPGLLLYVALVAVFSGLFAPINAGVLKMAYNAAHQEDFSIGTAFEYYRNSHFKELFIAATVIGFFSIGINVSLESLHIPVLGASLSYLLSFFTLLTIPLIIFGNLKAIDAIKASFMLVSKQFFVLLGLMIVAVIVAFLGLIGFCIGIIFTLPFIYSMNYMIYDQIIGTESHNELDQIGTSIE